MPTGAFNCVGLAHSVPAELRRHRRRLHHPPRSRRDPGLRRGSASRATVPKAPIIQAFTEQLARHAPRDLHGADERHPGRRHHLRRRLCGAAGLRHRLREGHLSLDPGARQHPRRARDPVSSATCRTRSAASPRSSSARSRSGLLSFGYLYAISIHNVPLAIVMSLLMWGVVYQGYNAIFPSFYPELFPTRTRVLGHGDLAEPRHRRHGAAAGAVRRRGASRRGQHPADRSARSPSASR